jgi:hypothetical protein
MRKSTQKVESTIGSRIIDREGVPVCVLRLARVSGGDGGESIST